MEGDLIRSSFLEFFQDKGHLIMPSSSLVPAGDPTLLFTSAGMVQFKPFFMGEATPPSRRLTTSQKSFRTTDIDEVGDHKHLTFFEMLGNFSIGDYFKKDAVAMAWEMVTQRFGISPDRIYATIYLDDDEAYSHWRDDIGIPEERIYRYGGKDNWWGPAGLEGPCGPCSELHYDSGAQHGCGPLVSPDVLTAAQRNDDPMPTCHPNCECERFVELWNLVFMQFYQDLEGNRTPLPAPSIDTGMGLERAAAVLQNKRNLYETDLFETIVAGICKLTSKQYGVDPDTDYAIRVVAEHGRGVSFLIADGVVPGNEGRGYVLRRIIRRAIRYGRRLGLQEPFLTEVASIAIQRFQNAYPELSENRDFIMRVISLEEERFAQTFERGFAILSDLIGARVGSGNGVATVSGQETFNLYDTYGFPPNSPPKSPASTACMWTWRVSSVRWKPSVSSLALPMLSRGPWKCSPPTRIWAWVSSNSSATLRCSNAPVSLPCWLPLLKMVDKRLSCGPRRQGPESRGSPRFHPILRRIRWSVGRCRYYKRPQRARPGGRHPDPR